MKRTTLAALGLALTVASGTAFAADASTTPPAGGPGAERPHHRMFEETDTNKDGAIGKDEWAAKSDRMFKERDVNNDGKISADEHKAHLEMMRAKFKERRAEHAGDKPAPAGEKPAAATPVAPAKH